MYPTTERDRAFFFRNWIALQRLHLQRGKSVVCGFYRAIVCSTPAVTARQGWKVTKIPLFVLLYCEGIRPPLCLTGIIAHRCYRRMNHCAKHSC
jgi:hypothetical protein